jgi:protein-S-isoprenylcysteine O-methyltransferase Ste14
MLLAFKVIEFINFIIFVVFIADVRKKKGMKSLVNEKLNFFMKLIFLASAGAYLYLLSSLDRILVTDYFAVTLTFSGMLLTAKAKLDLAQSHTWAGYGMDDHELVTRGIYQYIRHPLYTGIYVFMFGGLAIIIPRLPWFLNLLAVVIVVYFMISLAKRARLETRLLSDSFGEKYTIYKKQVYSFLPIRKYRG